MGIRSRHLSFLDLDDMTFHISKSLVSVVRCSSLRTYSRFVSASMNLVRGERPQNTSAGIPAFPFESTPVGYFFNRSIINFNIQELWWTNVYALRDLNSRSSRYLPPPARILAMALDERPALPQSARAHSTVTVTNKIDQSTASGDRS